jgi:anti-anti-sigma factor
MENKITFTDKDEYQVINIYGMFGSKTLFNIKKSIEIAKAKGFTNITLNLTDTTFIDNSALRYISDLQKDLENVNGMLYIVATPEKANNLFQKYLPETIPVYSSVHDLDNKLNSFVQVENKISYSIIKIPNDFDLNKLPSIRDAVTEIISFGHKTIVFDLSSTKTISSCGLGSLINVYKKLQNEKGNLYIIGGNNEVIKTLEMAKLLKIINHFNNFHEFEQVINQ